MASHMRSKHQGHAAEVGVLIRMLKLSTFPHLYMVYFRFRNDSMRQRWAKRRQLTLRTRLCAEPFLFSS